MNLDSIKKNIEKERVSWGELNYLSDHKKDILKRGDIELAQWAGIEEDEFNQYQNRRRK